MGDECKHGVLVEHNRERGGVNRECVLCINEAGRALFDRMANMLKELQFCGQWDKATGPRCPMCDAAARTGEHAPGCRLAALLAELT